MKEMNISILNSNINKLMANKHISQQQLANELDMTQSNFSRALNPSVKQCFTLNQVFKIAQFFDVSIDFLVGNKSTTKSFSEKEICKMLSRLIEKRLLIAFDYKRYEEIYPGGTYDSYYEDIEYHAFVFPNYEDVGSLDRFKEHEIEEMRDIAVTFGNDLPSNVRINNFLKRYLKIYDMYLHNLMDADLFHEISDKFLEDLK